MGQDLGRWVRERRNNLGLTQEQVAAAMSYEFDVPTNWVSSLEAGRRTYLPEFKYIEALASALRVLPTDVLRGAGVLPVDVEQAQAQAPGSQTIHALVDMIDWTVSPENRMNVEGLLRLILDRQQASSATRGGPAGSRAS